MNLIRKFIIIFFTIIINTPVLADRDITNLKWKPSLYKGKIGKSYEIVKLGSGEPVIGKKAFKFVAIPFDCGSSSYNNWYTDCGHVYQSTYSEKFKIGGGDRMRSEISTDTFKFPNPFWLSFSIYIPEDYVTISPTSVSMFQIWEANAGTNLMIEDINGFLVAKQQVLNRRTDKFPKGQNPWPRLIEIDEMRGKWTHFKIHTNQSDKIDKGFYKYYINDKLVAEYKGVTSDKKKEGMFLKAGIYQTGISFSMSKWGMSEKWEPRQDAGNFPTQIIYMDNIFYAKKESKLNKLINKAKSE
jgi:hypothetical protein